MAWDRPGASPFEPFTGDWFVSAGTDDVAYKRFQHSADLTGRRPTFSFRTSYDLEADYDYMFVEIHTVGEDDWTTLEENEGLNSDDTGLSCPRRRNASNWQGDIRSWPITRPRAPTARPARRRARRANGGPRRATPAVGSRGLDIPAAYQGKEVELLDHGRDRSGLPRTRRSSSTTRSSSPARHGGVRRPPSRTASAAGPPARCRPGRHYQGPSWTRAQDAPFVEGAATTTPDTVSPGLGLEKVQGEGEPGPHAPARGDGAPRHARQAGALRAGARPGLRRRHAAAGRGRRPRDPGQAGGRPGPAGVDLLQGDPRLAHGPGGDPPDLPEDGEVRCRTTVRLTSGKRVLGRATVTLRPGQARTVQVKLAAAARRLLTRRGRLRVQVRVEARDGAGLRGTSTRRITLRAVKGGRRALSRGRPSPAGPSPSFARAFVARARAARALAAFAFAFARAFARAEEEVAGRPGRAAAGGAAADAGAATAAAGSAGGRGAVPPPAAIARSAPATSSRPPVAVSGPYSETGTAVASSAVRTSAAVADGRRENRRAAAPVTMGAAKLVPEALM